MASGVSVNIFALPKEEKSKDMYQAFTGGLGESALATHGKSRAVNASLMEKRQG